MNTQQTQWIAACGLAFVLLLGGCDRSAPPPVVGPAPPQPAPGPGTYQVDVTDARPEALKLSDTLTDDQITDKKPQFVPELIDTRPLQGWQLNSSAAVIKLDVPMARPDHDRALLRLHASYSQARNTAHQNPLVSINMIDGKAKQFDDGLYAAIDQAYYQGLAGKLESHVQLVRRIFDKLKPDSPAATFLAAALHLANQEVAVADIAARDQLLASFDRDTVASKPISFYVWTDSLQRCWKFLRFLQQPQDPESRVIADIRAALTADDALLGDYRKAMEFYQRLTNPYSLRSVDDLIAGIPSRDPIRAQVSLFPPSTSREAELFNRIFAAGLPADADLMRELIRRIKSGEIDLAPRPDSGWYDHQLYALETFLLPQRGVESEKLLLTKEYKLRMLEAFKAMLTTRRETHARQLSDGKTMAEPPLEPPSRVKPRLRLEPAPTYYLRTARAYAFLQNFLNQSLGEEGLAQLHGLRATGERSDDLASELTWIRDLFYGFYLLSCEDIGLMSELQEGEVADAKVCHDRATAWLDTAWDDPDLAVDRRVSIPIFQDPFERSVTRLWVVVGVRVTRLNATYATAPSIRDPNRPELDWKPVERHELEEAQHMIAVDEFAEIELPGNVSISREELRKVLDEAHDKESAIELLQMRFGRPGK